VTRQQPDLFHEFPVHRLFRRLSRLDATLWKLPRVFSDPLAPENLVAVVAQDDADIGSVPISVNHANHL
jgi:hypothetical protein